MRWVALSVGLVFVVAGGLLWTLPVYTDLQATISGPSGGSSQGYIVSNNPPLAIFTPTITYFAGWTSPSNVTVTVYDCGASSGGCSTTRHVVASGSGFSGGVSWEGQKGEYYAVVPTGSAQVGVSYAEPLAGGLVGTILTTVGALLALYGLFTSPPAVTPPRPRPAGPPAARPPNLPATRAPARPTAGTPPGPAPPAAAPPPRTPTPPPPP